MRLVEQRGHRRAQNRAYICVVAVGEHLQRRRAAHRMRHQDVRSAESLLNDLIDEAAKVRAENAEIADMPFFADRQHAFGQPLSAPVHRRCGKAARAQVLDHLEIFLDELRPAGHQHRRRAMVLRREERGAKIAPVGAREIDRFGALRNLVRLDADEVGYGELSRMRRAMTLMSPLILRRPERYALSSARPP